MAGVNVHKAKYFPEILPGSGVGNLVANQPYTFENLVRFAKNIGELILKLKGVYSQDVSDKVSVYANVDGIQRKFEANSLALSQVSSDKFDYWLDLPAKGNLTIKALSQSNISNFPLFWLIEVTEPTVIEKLLYGITLTDDDVRIVEKYKLTNLVSSKSVITHNDYYIERTFISYSTYATVSEDTNPQIGSIITVPRNRYIVIDSVEIGNTDMAILSPQNYRIVINRDNDVNYVDINPAYGNAENRYYGRIPVWIPVTDRFSAFFYNSDTIPANTYVKIWYRLYPFGIADKIRWGFSLTPEEEKVAQEKDLYDKVKAGLV